MSRQKEVNKMASHEEVERQKILPQVGNTVRSKKYGTLWRVMEKREMWEHSADDPTLGDTRLIPAIYLRYWKIQERKAPGIGNMLVTSLYPISGYENAHRNFAVRN